MFKSEIFSERLADYRCCYSCIFDFVGSIFFYWIPKKRAFREHDVLYKYGILATKTIIIPYNRVQHVALHEGCFPLFGQPR
jgi:membrane protein YdbS with pleckstrin-like domain